MADFNWPVLREDWADKQEMSALAFNAYAAVINGHSTALATLYAALNAIITQPILSATKLTTARTINGVPFDGTADITVADSTKEPALSAGTSAQYYRGDKSWQTLNQDAVPDGTTNKAFLATERTKLSGIATGATANDTDANLKARANHTGTQTASTISDFSSAADARISAAVGVTVQAYDSDLTAFAAKTAPTGAVVGTTDTQTLTNKRVTPRVGSTTSSATPSIDIDSYDQYNITALAAAITGVTVTGTPTGGQKLLVRIKDNGSPRAITWGSSFVSSGTATLLSTTATSKTHLVGFIYDSTAAKWVCVAVDATGY